MSNRPWLRFSFGFALVLVMCAPAMAQTQSSLLDRTIPILQGICNGTTSNQTLQQGACDIGFGAGAQQVQNALSVTPREQTAAASNATQTTDTQVDVAAARLEEARKELPTGESRIGGFLNGSGGWGTVDSHGEIEEYDVWGGGAQAGIDYRLSDALVAGFGFGWNRQISEYEDVSAANGSGISIGGGEIESDSYSPSLYASFFQGPIHVDGILSYAFVDYEYDRPVILLDITNPVLATGHGDTDAHQFGANVNLGYEFQLGGLGAGPLAGVEFRQTWIDGYKEKGVPGFPLAYDDQDVVSLVTSLGGEAAYAISTGIGVLVPHARVTWEHEFENDARTIDARLYLNDDTTILDTLASRTSSPDRDYARLGAGVSAQFAEGISAFVDYDTVIDLDEVEHHRFTAGGRIAF